MNLATVLRYCDLEDGSIWSQRYYIMHDYKLMADMYKIGLNAIMTEFDFEAICEKCDGLIITGSASNIDPSYYGRPPFETPQPVDEYAFDRKLMDYFIENKKPIFGVCGGLQDLNVYFGGTLKKIEDTDKHHNAEKRNHVISIKENSFVYNVFKSTSATVNSHHAWAIDNLAPGLDAVATAEDGIIEAVECKEKNLFAAQWHPEQSFQREDIIENKFFENFISCCNKNK